MASLENEEDANRASRRRWHRSVTGCLTCRRRKVKCRSDTLPCDNCQRLNLRCAPSFHSNFKNWTQESPRGPTPATPATPIPNRSETSLFLSTADNPVGTQFDCLARASPGTGISDEHAIDGWVADDRESEIENEQHFDSGPPLMDEVLASMMPSSQNFGSSAHDWMFQYFAEPSSLEWNSFAGHQPQHSGDEPTSRHASSVSLLFEGSADFQTVQPGSLIDLAAGNTQHPAMNLQITMPNQNKTGEESLIHYYVSYLSTASSSKFSQWNFYTYMLRSQQGTSESPLRYGILAWTSSHLSWKDDSAVRSPEYFKASSAVNSMIADLSIQPRSPHLAKKHSQTADKLRLLLSTSFFLSHCDVIFGDHKALSERLDSIKYLLESQWKRFHVNLASLECHILVWLAYYDCRCILWSTTTETRRDCPEKSSSRGLMNIFNDFQALPSLLNNGRDYRKDCFGHDYPENEMTEDIKQEPINLISDNAISILCGINCFEIWNDTVFQERGAAEGLLVELRNSKIGELRANLGRLRAECKLIEQQHPIDIGNLDCQGFHVLTTTALHFSATILLNRIVTPDVRTDAESQAAAREIMNITRQLRSTKYLNTPRSLIWPLPIFMAGIEITDVFYQDWVLDYFSELWDWGASMRKTGKLLRKVIETQAETGRRAKVKDIMKEFGELIII